jgi:hypothetical protein
VPVVLLCIVDISHLRHHTFLFECIYVHVNIFSIGGILLISIDDEHLTFNSGCIFPGR